MMLEALDWAKSMNTRQLAGKVIFRVLDRGQSLTSALEDILQTVPKHQDRAFIQALCYGTLRHFHQLNFILGRLLEKPIKDQEVKALALIGLYQLQSMRVKDHAAVSETVSAANKKKWAKSLLNAVLRRYIRERQALDEAALKDSIAAYSHPRWIIKLLQQDWQEQAAQILFENNQPPPMALRVNLARIERQKLFEQLSVCAMPAQQSNIIDSAIILEKAAMVVDIPGFNEGLVSVQDTAAQLAASLLDVKPGHRVLDVCAAPGGKTAHILETYPTLGKLLAIDIEPARMEKTSQNLQRLNLSAELVVGDACNPEHWWDGKQFDRILLDVPCSALGVIRRHPDIKLLRKPADIQQLQQLQQKILETIWPLLKAGGILIYATCSTLKVENEQQIDNFITNHSDAENLPIKATWGISRPFGRQILPGTDAMDGFYYARIGKQKLPQLLP